MYMYPVQFSVACTGPWKHYVGESIIVLTSITGQSKYTIDATIL